MKLILLFIFIFITKFFITKVFFTTIARFLLFVVLRKTTYGFLETFPSAKINY